MRNREMAAFAALAAITSMPLTWPEPKAKDGAKPADDEIPEEFKAVEAPDETPPQPPVRRGSGRNAPCDCGSGVKYKKCCGKVK
jgi:uncharacterized protein YecA (UPF0149 family)